jgi:hypothetical protein
MYNPRHSLISTHTTTTYPSTLSSSAPLTPPASPRHSSRLHRSSKRQLRTATSTASLKPINEDGGKQEWAEVMRRQGNGGDVHTTPPASLRPSSGAGGATLKVPSRPTSTHVTPSPERPSSTARPSSTQPRSSATQTGRSQPKTSVERSRTPNPTMPPNNALVGLGLTLDQPNTVITSIKPVQAIAQPKRPKPIDVNPNKESMADEWERELIHSARNLHISMSQQQSTAKGKGKGTKDMEWERSGSWQEEVDPMREAEDRSRRDLKGERGE